MPPSVDTGTDLVPAAQTQGEGGPTLVLLHGQGATGAVWHGVVNEILTRRPGSRLHTPDLPGHGSSRPLRSYSIGSFAAAVADAVRDAGPLVLVGHSLGGMIALALADELFALDVQAVLCLSVKIEWTDQEIGRRLARAGQPVRQYASWEEAASAFARAAALDRAAWVTPDLLRSGIHGGPDAFRLAHDPATMRAPLLSVERARALRLGTRAPVTLACGEDDRFAGLDAMRRLGPAQVLPGVGHNPHIERPALVADLVLAQLPPVTGDTLPANPAPSTAEPGA